MSIKLWGFVLATYTLLTILEAFVGGADPDTSALASVMSTGVVRVQTIDVLLLPAFDVPLPNTDFIGAALSVATLDYSFFYGPFTLVRLLIGIPLWGMASYGLAVTLGPLLVAAGGVLARFIRG